jgi:arsenite methyltransferase
MRRTLTAVYFLGTVGIDNRLSLGVIVMTETAKDSLREEVRERYAEAARAVLNPASGSQGGCCGSSARDSCCGPAPAAREPDGWSGAQIYGTGETDGLPEDAVLASLGCGNPLAVADLHEGERVVDLGSGGGIDVLLSARRVGPSGFACGVDMTDDMLALARQNAAKAGASNVEFLKGEIEALPLADASVDVVISNCVINLSVDKPAVLAEMFRVLVPGGRPALGDRPRFQARQFVTATAARRLLAEFTGTGLLVAVVVGSGIAATRLTPDGALRLLANSLVTALGLAVLILIFAPAGGAHFNPVVTAADWLLNRHTTHAYGLGQAAAVIACQITGAIGGTLGTLLAVAPVGAGLRQPTQQLLCVAPTPDLRLKRSPLCTSVPPAGAGTPLDPTALSSMLH